MTYRWIAMGLLSVAAAAQADVQVTFLKSEKFSDIKDNNGFRQAGVLKEIEAHLVAQADKWLAGRDVRIEVTDVDLAGEVEPFGHQMQWMRVMRTVTLPSITFNYEVRDGGALVQQGQARLRDMNYQDGFNVYSGGEPLRYEKRMIDKWFKAEFAATVATARPR